MNDKSLHCIRALFHISIKLWNVPQIKCLYEGCIIIPLLICKYRCWHYTSSHLVSNGTYAKKITHSFFPGYHFFTEHGVYIYATSPGTYIFSATHQHVPKGENFLPMASILVNDLLGNKTPLPVFKFLEVVKKERQKKTEKLFKKLKITRKSQRENCKSGVQKE